MGEDKENRDMSRLELLATWAMAAAIAAYIVALNVLAFLTVFPQQ